MTTRRQASPLLTIRLVGDRARDDPKGQSADTERPPGGYASPGGRASSVPLSHPSLGGAASIGGFVASKLPLVCYEVSVPGLARKAAERGRTSHRTG